MVAEWMLKTEAWRLGPAFYIAIWLALALWIVSRRQETAHAELACPLPACVRLTRLSHRA
jgi:hypothetical protein